jgi:two-component system, LuxR family, response regulator FixJ
MADAIRLALIDDDAAVCDSLQLYFARHNVSVTCFHAADRYLEAVSASELFDCVVTDVRMPGISGLDLVRRIAVRGSSCPHHRTRRRRHGGVRGEVGRLRFH